MTASYLLLLSSSSSARALAPATRPAGSAAAGNMPCGPGMSRCSATTCSVDTKVGRLEETVPEPPRRAAVTSGGPWASGRTTAYSSGRLTLNFGRMYRRDGRAGHAVALPYVLHRVNLARRTCSASRPTPPKLSPVMSKATTVMLKGWYPSTSFNFSLKTAGGARTLIWTVSLSSFQKPTASTRPPRILSTTPVLRKTMSSDFSCPHWSLSSAHVPTRFSLLKETAPAVPDTARQASVAAQSANILRSMVKSLSQSRPLSEPFHFYCMHGFGAAYTRRGP